MTTLLRLVTGRRRVAVPLALLIALAAVSGVIARSLADVNLARHVVAGGGGRVAGGGFSIQGTVGQSILGTAGGPSTRIVGGFWAGLGGGAPPTPPGSATPATPTPSSTASTGATATPTGPGPSPTPGGAGQWTVNTTDDGGDGSCDSAHCSLREALFAAQGHAGPDLIRFAIPGGAAGCTAGGVCTIRPLARLPELGDGQTTIDGFSQPGAHPNTAPFGSPLDAALRIVLDGGALPAGSYAPGLDVRSAGNVIRGLVIHGFNTGIELLDATDTRLEGNYIGVDATGLSAPGNRCIGVELGGLREGGGSARNTIGGTQPAARNLISGNGCNGISLGPSGANLVQGNYIGTDATGARALPNAVGGVRAFTSSANHIGGAGAGEANLIAFNATAGVIVDASFGAAIHNTISRNRIHDNTGPGIFLEGEANAGLAAPVVGAVTATRATGSACAGCGVELFSDAAGQGAVFEGEARADATGRWALDRPGGLQGPFLTATATDADGNTSAFSAPVAVPVAGATATPTRGPTGTSSPAATATPTPTATTRPAGTPSPTASGTAPAPRWTIGLPWLGKEVE